MYLQKNSPLVTTGEGHRWTAGTSGCGKKEKVVPMEASVSHNPMGLHSMLQAYI
jgi:hypothetical protein